MSVGWDTDSNRIRRDSISSGSEVGSDQLERGYAVVSNQDPVLYIHQAFSAISEVSTSYQAQERGSSLEMLASIIQDVGGVVLPLIAASTSLLSFAFAYHDKRETSLELLTVYGYSAVAAITTTFFNVLTRGCKNNCEWDWEKKDEVFFKSIKNFGQIEGVIVNTVTGPFAVCYWIVQLMKSSDPVPPVERVPLLSESNDVAGG